MRCIIKNIHNLKYFIPGLGFSDEVYPEGLVSMEAPAQTPRVDGKDIFRQCS